MPPLKAIVNHNSHNFRCAIVRAFVAAAPNHLRYRKTKVLRCPLISSVTWVRSMPTTVAPLTWSPTYTVLRFTIAAGSSHG